MSIPLVTLLPLFQGSCWFRFLSPKRKWLWVFRNRSQQAREGRTIFLTVMVLSVLEFESRPPDHVIFICYRLDLYASPHLFNNTRPRILKGYEPHTVPLIICVILCLSAPVCSFSRDHSVSSVSFCTYSRFQ